MAIRATRRVADHHHAVTKHSKADDSLFAVVLSQVFRLERRTCKDDCRILKVEALASRVLQRASSDQK
jgi:hypothetical protein